jgi:hypothetical protein
MSRRYALVKALRLCVTPERAKDMKYILILSILAALLGGCAVAPAGHGDREPGSNRDDGNYRYRDYNDAKFRNYTYFGEHGSG